MRYPALIKKGFILPNGSKLKASSYEAAGSGRRLGTWGTSAAGPNTSVENSLQSLRSRSNEVIRNNPHAKAAVDAYASNLVGTGIVPRWLLEDVEKKKEIQKLWSDSADEADAHGMCDFYGLQELLARTVIGSGEALVRFRSRRPSDGYLVPLQIQILEPDFLRHDLSMELNNGNYIHMGVEFNAIGDRVAYHLWRSHPGDASRVSGGVGFTRVPASEMLQIFKPVRPGQVRGIPWLSSILVWLHELDQYEDAELVRKKTAAFFSAFVTRPSTLVSGEPNSVLEMGTDEGLDDEQQQMLGFEPGTLQYLEEGEDIRFSEPADVGGNYEVWIRRQLQSIAAGIGITYEQLTGDLSKVNYTSIRAGLIEFRRRCEALQHNLIVFQFCRPYVSRWLDTAVLANAIQIPDYMENRREYLRIEWRPPGWAFVDPLKDEMAAQMAVRNGTESRQGVAATKGYDVEEIDKQRAADNEREEELGLVSDSNPAATAKSGAMQKAEQKVMDGAATGSDQQDPEDDSTDQQDIAING